MGYPETLDSNNFQNEGTSDTADDVIEENKFRGMFPFATRDFSDKLFNNFYVF